MNPEESVQDLVVLTPDKNTQCALDGLLSRPGDLAIRRVSRTIIVHSQRDAGVRKDAHEFLRAYLRKTQYAVVVLDREGCGKEDDSREAIENEIEKNLSRNGWNNRCAAIVIDPELESWVWTPDHRVAEVLGLGRDYTSLENWLTQEGYLPAGKRKPDRPKEAMEAVLRRTRIPRSSALYKKLAEKVRLKGCTDPAFVKLATVLRAWFPPQ